jgi:DNA-binding IclR family transcriptional regulator
MTEPTESSQALGRYVAILDLFAGLTDCWPSPRPHGQGLSVADVSQCLEISKGTISRYLHRMEDVGLLVRTGDRRYTLSSRVYHWGRAATPRQDVAVRARPAMDDLADAFGEPVSLFVLDADAALCIEQVEGRFPLRLNAAIGRRLPLHTGSSPRLLLAFATPEYQSQILAQAPFPALAPNTITDAGQLRRALAAAREDEYVISDGEANEGVIGIAAPIRDASSEVCAALSIAGPRDRMSGAQQWAVLTALRSATRDISAALGYVADRAARATAARR